VWEEARVTDAYINRIATAVPRHDVHQAFVAFARALYRDNPREQALIRRMADKAGIEHRYSCLAPADDPGGATVDAEGFYRRGAFPSTGARMRMFEAHAPALAEQAIGTLLSGRERNHVSHLLVTCCTGFSAPGLDLEIIERCDLPAAAERTMVGFMGCYAAMNALKLARHIVRSEPKARVLMVNLELCTLHLHEAAGLEELLSFLVFSDGCAASLVTAEARGIALDSFRAVLVPRTRGLITWTIRDSGFDMVLSGQVPAVLRDGLKAHCGEILGGQSPAAIDLWAVHPGGRTVLDAVERAFDLDPDALLASREVLRTYGNMSSPTVMFVLEALMRGAATGAQGCAMAFGPGLVAETLRFHMAS
jgi:predicted naringenin-chalcone synthase